MKRRKYTDAEIHAKFLEALNREANGVQRVYALKHQLTPQYVNDLARGRRPWSEKILDLLDLERIEFVVDKKRPPCDT